MRKHITDPLEFLQQITDNDETTIKFTKANKEPRLMRCTLNFKRIPEDQHPKNFDMKNLLKLLKTNKIVHVYDLEKSGWRSVPIDRTEWIENETGKFRVILK